jgi:hypothetical protein
MKKQIILSLSLLWSFNGLQAQEYVDVAIHGSNSQLFGTFAIGKQFHNGLNINLISSFGNFGTHAESRTWGSDNSLEIPYDEEHHDVLPGNPGSEVVAYKTASTGAGLGLGVGYSLQLNDRNSLHAEAQAQIYFVEDAYVRRTASNLPPHDEYENTRYFKHKNGSAALNLDHVIRINHLFSVYYGISATFYLKDVFQKAQISYDDIRVNDNYFMDGFRPVVHAGLRLTFPQATE